MNPNVGRQGAGFYRDDKIEHALPPGERELARPWVRQLREWASGPTVIPLDGVKAKTVELGPGSTVSAVWVKAPGGPEILLGVGSRYPVGDWTGIWSVRPALEKVTIDTGGTTWRAGATTRPEHGGPGKPPYAGEVIEVVGYPTIELAAAAPLMARRAPLLWRSVALTGPVMGGGETIGAWCIAGRRTAKFLIQAGANALHFAVYGVACGNSVPQQLTKQLWPLAGYQAVAAANAYEVNLDVAGWEWLVAVGAFDAVGSGADLLVQAED